MQPMTLREAVEIERIRPPSTPRWTDFDDEPGIVSNYKRDTITYARARAIVDAAVEAHEARIKCGEVQDAEPFDGEAFRVSWERLCDLDDKLRALERGEGGEVQP